MWGNGGKRSSLGFTALCASCDTLLSSDVRQLSLSGVQQARAPSSPVVLAAEAQPREQVGSPINVQPGLVRAQGRGVCAHRGRSEQLDAPAALAAQRAPPRAAKSTRCAQRTQAAFQLTSRASRAKLGPLLLFFSMLPAAEDRSGALWSLGGRSRGPRRAQRIC